MNNIGGHTRRSYAYAKKTTCQHPNKLMRVLGDFEWTVAVTIKARRTRDCNKITYRLLFQEWKIKGARVGLMVPEYDKLGRLHYHGTIYLPINHRMTHYHDRMFSICTKLIRTIEDEESWNIYCLKEYDTIDDRDEEVIQIPRTPMWKDLTRRIHPKSKLEKLLDNNYFDSGGSIN